MRKVSEAELHAYADSALDRRRLEAVRRHLAAFPADAARVEHWQRQNEMIRAAFPPAGSGQVPRSLLVSAQRMRERNRYSGRERWFGLSTALAFASGALLSASTLFAVSRLTEPDGAQVLPAEEAAGAAGQSLAGLAAASLREFAAMAGRGLSQSEAARGAGLEVPVMPALAAGGLKLAAIRAIPYGKGQALCIYYTNHDGGPIALCAGGTKEPGETQARLTGQSPAAAISWRQKGADYVLLGALSGASLQKLAGELRSEIAGFGGR